MSKKLYVYEYVDGLTQSYHGGGGLMILTAGDPQEALNAQRAAEYAKYDDEPFLTELPEPTRVIEVVDTEADAVFEFPDEGCC